MCRNILFLLFVALSYSLYGQNDYEPLPLNRQRAVIENGDTIPFVRLRPIYIFPRVVFKNEKEEIAYWRMVRDVKKTLPYAKLIYETLLETYEYMETLPNDKEKTKHLKKMEKELFDTYKPVLKKLTLRQGKLLIKLIDRECNQSSYVLIKAFLGSFRAGFWNTFASIFGASLKQEWEPQGRDKEIERICILVESGQL
ncbi:MAG: DUF4294 domain-containing protein [Bacteroidales bacterium]